VFHALCEASGWDRVTIPVDTDPEAAFQNWSRDRPIVYALFRSDDRIDEWADIDDVVFTTPATGEYCSACDANAAVSIRMGTPPKTTQAKRDSKNCSHANLARKCDCASLRYYRSEISVGTGPECVIKNRCAKCGADI
jgi:hypothetical protein